MTVSHVEHEVTIVMVNDIPARLVFAGQRWRVTDTPTRLRESIWSALLDAHCGLYGWRFQATSDSGESIVFDVYRERDNWHVHHMYL